MKGACRNSLSKRNANLQLTKITNCFFKKIIKIRKILRLFRLTLSLFPNIHLSSEWLCCVGIFCDKSCKYQLSTGGKHTHVVSLSLSLFLYSSQFWLTVLLEYFVTNLVFTSSAQGKNMHISLSLSLSLSHIHTHSLHPKPHNITLYWHHPSVYILPLLY